MRRNKLKKICYILYITIFFALFQVLDTPATNADTVDYIVNVAPSLNITISSSNVVLDLNPNTKTSDSKDVDITVSTNNITGYKLTMSSTGNQTNLVKTDDNTKWIPTLSAAAGTTASSLADNTWGYRQDNTGNFLPFSSTKILQNNSATNGDNTTLSFASKINYNQAAGSYAIDLSFTATANPTIFIDDITTMQEFGALNNTEKEWVIENMVAGQAYTLKDVRDNQQYKIAKLADNKVWLLDNLRLGSASIVQPLSADNTNMNSSVPFSLPASSASGFNTYTTARIDTANANADSVAKYGGTKYGEGSGKIGVYYNYCAASAGTYCYAQGSGAGRNATYDVCPSGWQLPTANSLLNLLSDYSFNNFKNAFSVNRTGLHVQSEVSLTTRMNIWTSTYGLNNSTGEGMKYLHINDTEATSGGAVPNDGYRTVGMAIRCILKES